MISYSPGLGAFIEGLGVIPRWRKTPVLFSGLLGFRSSDHILRSTEVIGFGTGRGGKVGVLSSVCEVVNPLDASTAAPFTIQKEVCYGIF